MDGISQFVWIFFSYNDAVIGPNLEVVGWNNYVMAALHFEFYIALYRSSCRNQSVEKPDLGALHYVTGT